MKINANSEVAADVLVCRRGGASRRPTEVVIMRRGFETFPHSDDWRVAPRGGTPRLYGRRGRPPLHHAFTMIEIAIALAVIAFALVAIIGVLPTGLSVQKDNREDTIINQDGPYWMQAIRNGAKGLDHLTNYVETITVKRSGRFNGPVINTEVIYTNSPGLFDLPLDGSMTNGQRIIGLLSRPRYEGDATSLTNRITNSVSARVRALTGAAVDHGKIDPSQSALTDFSFSYILEPEILPFIKVQVVPDSTNYCAIDPNVDPAERLRREIKFREVKTREMNASEIRLVFRWALLPGGRTGPNRQIFREIVSGKHDASTGDYFFQPQNFAIWDKPLPPCQ